MLHLLNLLAAIALLVWGTHIVRTGMLRVFGEKLREMLATSTRNRLAAAGAGLPPLRRRRADVPSEDVRELLQVARRRPFSRGEVVFHRDDPGDSRRDARVL